MESTPNPNTLSCPTRPDDVEALIAQTITGSMCQSRQRGLYHKCWSCAHRNGAEHRRPAPVLAMSSKPARIEAEAV